MVLILSNLRHYRWMPGIVALTLAAYAVPIGAQIRPDTTLGDESSVVRSNVELPNGLGELIEGGAERGSNLFHSFQEFNIGEGQQVYFANPAGIESILGRVTGSDPSAILGTLGVRGRADLFLINPNGILLGENAALDVSGSFYATTADAVPLGNEGVFRAIDPASSRLLSVRPGVSFLNYLTADSGAIENRATLRGTLGQGLTLSGHTITNSGDLRVAAGTIRLETPQTPAHSVSLKEGVILTNVPSIADGVEGGDIRIMTHDLAIADGVEIRTDVSGRDSRSGQIQIEATGDVSLARGALISSIIRDEGTGNSGGVSINANSFTMNDSAKIQTDIRAGQGATGPIEITTAGDVTLNGTATSRPRISSNILNDNVGRTGGIAITANNIAMNEGASIAANVAPNAQGRAGPIALTAAANVTLDNSARIISNVDGQGTTGGLQLTAGGDVAVANDASIASNFQGTTGTSGGIAIAASNLFLSSRASIRADVLGGGDSGPITITASESVAITDEIVGDATVDQRRSRITSNVSQVGRGDSGGITIEAADVLIENAIGILSNTGGVGDSGGIAIMAQDAVMLRGIATFIGSNVDNSDGENIAVTGTSGGIAIDTTNFAIIQAGEAINGELNRIGVTVSTGEIGNAGTLRIKATDSLIVAGEGAFITNNVGTNVPAETGGLSIITRDLSVLDGANISASAVLGQGTPGALSVESGQGNDLDISLSAGSIIGPATVQAQPNNGNLTIQSDRTLSISGPGEIAIVSAESSLTSVGNLAITADRVVLDDGVAITTRNDSTRSGGNIDFNVDEALTLRRGSSIVAESTNPLGSSGSNINIDSPFVTAIPDENSDIIASSASRDGGNVVVDGWVVGLTEREGSIAALRGNTSSDISASDDFEQRDIIDAIAPFDEPDVAFIGSFTTGLNRLVDDAVDSSALIAGSCIAQGSNRPEGDLTISGFSGLPQKPGDISSSNFPTGDVQSLPDPAPTAPEAPAATDSDAWQLGNAIVEPDGLYQLAGGRLFLGRPCEDDRHDLLDSENYHEPQVRML